MAHPKAGRRGFSLVELLVVIAIIALLVAMVVPSLSHVRLLAMEGVCRSNLSQLSKAYYTYCAAHGGKTLPYVYNEQEGLPFEHFWMEVLSRYHANVGQIRDCPVVTQRSGGWGSTFTAWGPNGGFIRQHSGSYAINGWVYDMGWDGIHHVWHDTYDFDTIFVTKPSEVPAFADSSWVDTWPWETDVPVDVLIGSQGGESCMGRVCVRRHGMAINVGFVDGHAAKVPLDDLWTLEWHVGWKPEHNIHVPDPYDP